MHQHNEVLRTRISFAIASIESVVAFFAGSEEVTRAEFRVFTKRFWKNQRNSGIQVVKWIPRVKATDRAAYEAAEREDGYKEFVFTERASHGEMVPAGDQALEGIETSNYNLTLSTRAGVGVDILLNSTTRRDVEGNIIGAIDIGQDITEIKLYQAQVIQASKLATLGEM